MGDVYEPGINVDKERKLSQTPSEKMFATLSFSFGEDTIKEAYKKLSAKEIEKFFTVKKEEKEFPIFLIINKIKNSKPYKIDQLRIPLEFFKDKPQIIDKILLQKNQKGQTPMHLLMQKEDKKTVVAIELILDSLKERPESLYKILTEKDFNGNTPIDIAIKEKNLSASRKILAVLPRIKDKKVQNHKIPEPVFKDMIEIRRKLIRNNRTTSA